MCVKSTPPRRRGTHPVGLTAMPDETSVPAGLDWDLWLGGADMRAYNPTFTPYNWRGYFDFGTGQLGNWGIHVLGPVNLALQLGARQDAAGFGLLA